MRSGSAWSAAIRDGVLHDRALFSSDRPVLGWFDVVIDPKEVIRIVLFLDGCQAGKIGAEGCVDDGFGLDVERPENMHACGDVIRLACWMIVAMASSERSRWRLDFQ